MANYKLSKDLKKRMEKELRQYWGNINNRRVHFWRWTVPTEMLHLILLHKKH